MASPAKPKTEAEVIKELTRLTARVVIPVMPGAADNGPNGLLIPGTEGLATLVDHAAEAWLRTNNRPVFTPGQLRAMSAQFARLTQAIAKAYQEGRFK